MANGSGTVGSANITNVAVTCTAASTYSIGGTVSGLSGTVVLQDNGGNDLSVGASGAFTFSTALATGSAYSVTVKTNPAGQTCSVANGSGTVGSANITNVAVTCTAATTYSVGGTVSGLSGTVVLQDNGGNDLSVSASGPFTFSTALATGSAYNVTVKTSPAGPDVLGGQRVRHGRVREHHQRRRHLHGELGQQRLRQLQPGGRAARVRLDRHE